MVKNMVSNSDSAGRELIANLVCAGIDRLVSP
ncbi:hypothetical protein SAMN05216388_100987 [Halorientalis persicus]|uniref:Uncharacterized protein n=1 Tax=Halorientalis persicus TaxID=1367881 RepID=A0A1H8MQV7_9EURY|nr:hypothetical protein SAMN05216388_100987 [Halorientalis persicus]